MSFTAVTAASASFLAAILLLKIGILPGEARPAGALPGAAPQLETPPERERRLREAAQRDPKDARAREILGSYYLERGRPFAALWELQEALTLQPQDFLSRINLGNAFAAAGWPSEARAVFEEMLRRQPGRLEVCRRLADLALQSGQPEEAIRFLELGHDLRHSPDALIVLGEAYRAMGKLPEARAAFEDSRRLLLENPEVFYRLGVLFKQMGRLDDAKQSFMAVTFWSPRRPDAHCALGLVALKQKRPEDGRAAFEAALRIAPGYGPAQLQLGLMARKSGSAKEARRWLSEAVKHGPTRAEAHRELSQLAEAVGDRAAAYRHRGAYYHARGLHAREAAVCRAWAAALPGDVEAVLALPQVEREMNHAAAALRIVEAALKRHPREPRLYERVVVLSIESGQPDRARTACAAWRRLQPRAAGPLWGQALYELAGSSYGQAVRLLTEAVAREPRNAEIRFTLGEAHTHHFVGDNWGRAEAQLARAVSLAPANVRYRALWAEALRQLGRTEEARAQFLRSLDLDPLQDSPLKEPLDHLAQIARDTHRTDQAALWDRLARAAEARRRQEMRLRQQTWDHPGDPDGYLALARHLIGNGDVRAAESQLEEALRLRPGQPEVAALKGRVDRGVAVE